MYIIPEPTTMTNKGFVKKSVTSTTFFTTLSYKSYVVNCY